KPFPARRRRMPGRSSLTWTRPACSAASLGSMTASRGGRSKGNGLPADRDLTHYLSPITLPAVECWRARWAPIDRDRTLPSIGPATPRSDGRPHARDEFGQHHITHAPVTALAKPIEGLSCSVLACFSCGIGNPRCPFHPELSRPSSQDGGIDRSGCAGTLAQVTHLAEARSLAQGGPSEETHWVLGPEPVRAGDWATARLADAGSRAHRQLPVAFRDARQANR